MEIQKEIIFKNIKYSNYSFNINDSKGLKYYYNIDSKDKKLQKKVKKVEEIKEVKEDKDSTTEKNKSYHEPDSTTT